MNKIVSIKDTNAIFLAIVLVTGIVALSSLSFITASALTGPLFTEDNNYESTGYQPDYAGQKSNSYESKKYELDSYEKPSYRNDNYHQQPEYSTYTPDYKPQYPSYGHDSKTYNSKDSSSVFVKKVKCNNINVNINGLDINATGADAADSSIPVTDAVSSQGYGENNGYKKSDNGFKFVCINNNNNTVIIGNGTTTPEPLTCEECFTSILTEEELNALIEATTLPDSLPELCNEFIEGGLQTEQGRTFISNYLFTSGMAAGILVDKINAILDCLEEVYGVNFPRP